jgi:hypothetical protein
MLKLQHRNDSLPSHKSNYEGQIKAPIPIPKRKQLVGKASDRITREVFLSLRHLRTTRDDEFGTGGSDNSRKDPTFGIETILFFQGMICSFGKFTSYLEGICANQRQRSVQRFSNGISSFFSPMNFQ